MNIQKKVYEKMGWCWQECYPHQIHIPSFWAIVQLNTDLTTPEGFFKLFNAMKESGDWDKFVYEKIGKVDKGAIAHPNVPAWTFLDSDYINPTAFLNAVAEFYGLEE